MCVNAQGMRQQLEEPKIKTNMYCMHLKGCLELRRKKFVRNTNLKGTFPATVRGHEEPH
jgi:hypothetical protein